jgi:hypothetical protein
MNLIVIDSNSFIAIMRFLPCTNITTNSIQEIIMMMNNIRKILLSLAIAISLGVFSAQSFAGAAADIDNVLVAIIAAEDAIQAGAEGQEVYKLIKVATKRSGEINASDKISAERSRANSYLKKARSAAKKGDLQGAGEHLKAGYKKFNAMKGMIN